MQEAGEQEARKQDAGDGRVQFFSTYGPFQDNRIQPTDIYVAEGRRVAQGGTSSGSSDRCAGLMASATGCIPGPPSLPVRTADSTKKSSLSQRPQITQSIIFGKISALSAFSAMSFCSGLNA